MCVRTCVSACVVRVKESKMKTRKTEKQNKNKICSCIRKTDSRNQRLFSEASRCPIADILVYLFIDICSHTIIQFGSSLMWPELRCFTQCGRARFASRWSRVPGWGPYCLCDYTVPTRVRPPSFAPFDFSVDERTFIGLERRKTCFKFTSGWRETV